MKKLEVFDPAMCVSTGLCGVDVDPVLVRFAANPAVLNEMEAGMDRLPIIVVDEVPYVRRVADERAPHCALVPWLAQAPVGIDGLKQLAR